MLPVGGQVRHGVQGVFQTVAQQGAQLRVRNGYIVGQ